MSAIIGHEGAVATFLDALAGDRLHHAWLLAGPQGVGKGSFARAAALRLLAAASGSAIPPGRLDVPEEHSSARLIAAGSHPDFKLLTRLVKDRSEELARSITVDQVRALQPLFATTPSLSPRRVVVIDAADDLERAAANALLKNLEEPPAGTLFLLVAHAPGRLLPTIRSRCRVLRFGRLDGMASAAVLGRVLPDSSEAEIAALVRVAQGAPGQATRFAGLDIAGLDAAIERIAMHGDPTNALRSALARTLSGKAAQPRYEAFLDRAPSRIAAAARDGHDIAARVGLWREARSIADGAVRLSLDPQLTVFELAALLARLAPEGVAAKA